MTAIEYANLVNRLNEENNRTEEESTDTND